MNTSLQKYRNWEANTEEAPVKLHFHRILKAWTRQISPQEKTTNEAVVFHCLAPVLQALLPGLSTVNKAFTSKNRVRYKQCPHSPPHPPPPAKKKWVRLFPGLCKLKVL